MSELEHAGEQSEHDDLYLVRHGLAHVLAQAVLEVRPGTTLGFGPPIRDGFYYDFILSQPLSEEDFPEIERRMKKILTPTNNRNGNQLMNICVRTEVFSVGTALIWTLASSRSPIKALLSVSGL